MADTYKQELLQDTLSQRFDMERFVRFISELFNDVQMKNQYVADIRIWKEYSGQIASYTRVASYIDTKKRKLEILAVEVKNESTVERARSLQRNFISRLITGTATAAIVAFYDPNSENWRLSFVKLDYAFTPKGVTVEVTPAKRSSYLVGKGEGIHTVQRQLLPIFKNERDNPTVEEIEEAFSVETVTKEFFASYKEQYLRLKEYLDGKPAFTQIAEKNNFTSEQFAKKLMGQLAFLYFLQKKGWLGVSVAPKELTKEQFEKIYYSQKSEAREVFVQHYVRTPEGSYRRYKIKELEKDRNKADIFAGCFKGTQFYNTWGEGNINFIRSIYENCIDKKSDFFRKYLEPLFYNALNNPRGENDYFPRFNSKIPFLNGGLFEPLFTNWQAIDLDIPNWIFSKEGTDAKKDGILDVFDTFNFTISEDEPLEREVAVDPEMLGKIFENLLDVKDRKSKGAFYTPREIVHYMCQESLINYLVNEIAIPYEDMKQFVLYGEVITNQDSSKKTLDGKRGKLIPQSVFEKLDSIDEKLDSVRIADPAVGSGAFPLGILNEIIKLRNNITQYKVNEFAVYPKTQRDILTADILRKRNVYDLKWNTIQNCIFAVDIEASAVDITKLRLWLSLVVDQPIDEINPKPHALPNLDCNIMCGNSLIEEFEGIQLFDEKLLEQVDLSKPLQQRAANGTQLMLDTAKQEQELDTMFKELFAMQGDLFGEDDPLKKKEIKKNIEKKTSDIIDYKLNGIDKNHEAAKRYRQSIDNHEKPYFIWKLEFARVFKEKEGFDIVIGNPPYVGESGHKDIFRTIASTEFGKRFYLGKMDLFYFFFHKGLDILHSKGELCLITTNYYTTAMGAKKLRTDLRERAQIRKLINFNEVRVFESALGQHNMITSITKNFDKSIECTSIICNESITADGNKIKDILYGVDKNTIQICIEQDNIYDGQDAYIRLNGVYSTKNNSVESILCKVASQEITLGKICDINQGVVSGCDYVSNRNIGSLIQGDNVELKDGIFVLDLLNHRDREIIDSFNEKEKMLLKPFFKNSEIQRYYCNKNNTKYLLYLSKQIQSIEEFPNVIKHLDRFKPVLDERREAKKGVIKYFHLQWARTQEIFIKEKIVVPYRTKVNSFAYNNCEWFCRSDAYVITLKDLTIDLKYLLALLNSKLYYIWLYHRGKRKGEILELFQVPLSEIPIKVAYGDTYNKMINYVRQIMQSKELNPQSDTSYLEEKINQLVYELYHLTPEEVKIVEENAK